MLELNLYKEVNNNTFVKQLAILGVLFISSYFIFPSVDIVVYFVITLIFIFYSVIIEKENPAIGTVQLDEHSINFITKENEINLNLRKNALPEIKYSGYKGKKVTGDFVPKFNKFSGLDNYINFDINNENYEFKFYVENKEQENKLIELVNQWKSFGYDISEVMINQ